MIIKKRFGKRNFVQYLGLKNDDYALVPKKKKKQKVYIPGVNVIYRNDPGSQAELEAQQLANSIRFIPHKYEDTRAYRYTAKTLPPVVHSSDRMAETDAMRASRARRGMSRARGSIGSGGLEPHQRRGLVNLLRKDYDGAMMEEHQRQNKAAMIDDMKKWWQNAKILKQRQLGDETRAHMLRTFLVIDGEQAVKRLQAMFRGGKVRGAWRSEGLDHFSNGSSSTPRSSISSISMGSNPFLSGPMLYGSSDTSMSVGTNPFKTGRFLDRSVSRTPSKHKTPMKKDFGSRTPKKNTNRNRKLDFNLSTSRVSFARTPFSTPGKYSGYVSHRTPGVNPFLDTVASGIPSGPYTPYGGLKTPGVNPFLNPVRPTAPTSAYNKIPANPVRTNPKKKLKFD